VGLSHVWEVYATSALALPALAMCESVFQNELRGRGWEAHSARYPILARAVRRALKIQTGEQDSDFDDALRRLCEFPGHRRETYALLQDALASPKMPKFGPAQQLSYLYKAYATDREVRQLNGDLRKTIVELLGSDASGEGAAIAVGNICAEYARFGPIPAEWQAILRDEAKIATPAARDRLNEQARKLEKQQPAKVPEGAVVLAEPWDSVLEKQVATIALANYRDGQHGASVTIGGHRLWIDGVSEWPEEIRGKRKPFLLSGRLTKVHDLEVFRYQPGEPFVGQGIPVPEGYDLKQTQTRYVLKDAKWTLMKARE
jgi:hypothetical protein